MNRIINSMLIFILLVLISSVSALEENNNSELLSFCPVKGEIESWHPDGEPELANGEDLYLVINGGAEIYHEYGFKNAIFQTYADSIGNSINLEIYEMESNAAAFGIYSFKTGKEGIPLKLGYQVLLESYYINFWEGNYLITLTSMQTDSPCINDLKNIANTVDSKIKYTSAVPSLVSFLPGKQIIKNGITFLKGHLALFNQNIFGSENVFGLKEGVIGEYPDYSIIVIKYESNLESIKWYKSAANYFNIDKGYKNFVEHETHFETSDLKNNKLWIKHFINYIIVIYGNKISNAQEIFNSVIENIRTSK